MATNSEDKYVEFLKKLEKSDIPEDIKFMFRNSWYGGYHPTNTTLPIEAELK